MVGGGAGQGCTEVGLQGCTEVGLQGCTEVGLDRAARRWGWTGLHGGGAGDTWRALVD